MQPALGVGTKVPNDKLPFHLWCATRDCDDESVYLNAANLLTPPPTPTPTPTPVPGGSKKNRKPNFPFNTWSNMSVNGGGAVGSTLLPFFGLRSHSAQTEAIVITLPEKNGGKGAQSLFLPAQSPNQYVIVSCMQSELVDEHCPWVPPTR